MAQRSDSLVARAMSFRPLRFLGKYSYGIYVYQQIFFVLVNVYWLDAMRKYVPSILLLHLSATFLVAAHHGVTLAAEELPRLDQGDMVREVAAALDRSGFRSKLLTRCTWKTAAELGIVLKTLYNKLKLYNIEAPDKI